MGISKPASKSSGSKQPQKASAQSKGKYPKLDLDGLKDKHRDLQSKSGGNFLKIEGETRFRIVPFEHDGDLHVFAEFNKHYVQQLKASFNCLHDTEDDCPICNLVEEFDKMGASNLARGLAARTRFLMNVLHAGELKKVEIGGGVMKDILSYFADPDYGDISDPDTGRDIKITKTGSGLTTEYAVKVVPNSSRIVVPDNVPDLIKFVKYPKTDDVETELAKVFDELQQAAEEESN